MTATSTSLSPARRRRRWYEVRPCTSATLSDCSVRPGDIARLTFYAVGWAPDIASELVEGSARAQASDGFSSPMPPMTLISVEALWTPELLVEIEATAVLHFGRRRSCAERWCQHQ